MTRTKQEIEADARRVTAHAQVLYTLDDAGELASYSHDLTSGDVAGPLPVASGPDFRLAFSGGDGVIYAIADNGDLLWFRHDGRVDGSFKWADNNARKIGVGWNMKHVFAG